MKIICKTIQASRKGIRDIWNAFMVEGAQMLDEDIPYCPNTASELPTEIITWDEAKSRHKHQLRLGNKEYASDAFVCWYLDDWKFDTPFGIWWAPWRAIKILVHYKGIITPDFSICQDFPKPIKLFNVYRMRAFGFWCGSFGLEVINNVRWGTEETWEYCFTGIPRNSMVAIGTVASSLRSYESMMLFKHGLLEMMRICNPQTIIVYGSANYTCLQRLKKKGIRIAQYDSAAAKRFANIASIEAKDDGNE